MLHFLLQVTQDISFQTSELDSEPSQLSSNDPPKKLIEKDIDPMKMVSLRYI